MAQKILVGTRKGLVTFGKQNGNWCIEDEEFAAIPVSYAMRDTRTGTLWACLDHGHWGRKLHRSDDNGTTWREISSPKYPEGETRPDDGEPAVVSYIWLVQEGGKDEPNVLYCGVEPGGLFRSDDGGENFQLVETLWQHESRKNWFGGGRDHAGLCSICVDPRDSRHVTIGISVGGVYETRDGGETWEGRNKGLLAEYMPNPEPEYGHDPHFMLASPSNPDVLWQQNHCGVFRTENGGKQWENISQKGHLVKFGFPIVVDENDDKVAWVVPAQSDEYRIPINRALVVCRTDDGGKTWQEFRTGLPQEDCYDICFRHAFDKRGETLAFGTTAGNLYLSEDRGESWKCISNNLADVYSVRFAEV
jgi:hypothetical protein